MRGGGHSAAQHITAQHSTAQILLQVAAAQRHSMHTLHTCSACLRWLPACSRSGTQTCAPHMDQQEQRLAWCAQGFRLHACGKPHIRVPLSPPPPTPAGARPGRGAAAAVRRHGVVGADGDRALAPLRQQPHPAVRQPAAAPRLGTRAPLPGAQHRRAQEGVWRGGRGQHVLPACFPACSSAMGQSPGPAGYTAAQA